MPREDLGTWDPGRGPATVQRQVDRARVEETQAHVWVLPVGIWPGPPLSA